jgi:hypothetical protein
MYITHHCSTPSFSEVRRASLFVSHIFPTCLSLFGSQRNLDSHPTASLPLTHDLFRRDERGLPSSRSFFFNGQSPTGSSVVARTGHPPLNPARRNVLLLHFTLSALLQRNFEFDPFDSSPPFSEVRRTAFRVFCISFVSILLRLSLRFSEPRVSCLLYFLRLHFPIFSEVRRSSPFVSRTFPLLFYSFSEVGRTSLFVFFIFLTFRLPPSRFAEPRLSCLLFSL